MEDKWVKAADIAKHLNVSISFLANNRRHAESGKVIPYSQLGRKVLYNIGVVDDFVKNKLGQGFA